MIRKIINKLKEYLYSLEIDNYNEYTRQWSKGYRKGVSDSINLVEQTTNEEGESLRLP